MKRCVTLVLVGCSAREPATSIEHPIAHAPAASWVGERTAPVARPPFDWALAVAEGDGHRSVAVAQRVKRFPKARGSTSEVVLQERPRIVARTLYEEESDECPGDALGIWSLGFTIAGERWHIPDFAEQYTDCAPIPSGFDGDSIRIEARDLVPGDPLEIVVRGEEWHDWYDDACECSAHSGRSDHLWACGIAASGVPVCWAHVETSRELRARASGQDCACAASIAEESWTVDAEFISPGKLRVGGEERALTKLPCVLEAPPREFGC